MVTYVYLFKGTAIYYAESLDTIGDNLKEKGLINAMPDLADLEEGDLKYKVDFKNVYATVLKNWLAADDMAILKKQYDYLKFV